MKSLLLFFAAFLLSSALSAQNVNFTVYNMANTPAFTTNSFKQIAIGKHNHLWVGTTNEGIYKYNGKTWVKGTALLNNNIKSICRTPDSMIVIGQAGKNGAQASTGGLNLFSDTTFVTTYWSALAGLPSRFVNGACVSSNGTIWTANSPDVIGSTINDGGIGYKTSAATNFSHLGIGLPTNDTWIYSIATNNTEVWAGINKACPSGGCVSAGILRYSVTGAYLGKFDTTNTPIPFQFHVGAALVRAICFTGTNDAWVGLNTGGLAVYSGGTWTLIKSTNSKFPNGAVVNYNAMKADKNGKVYIGTNMGLLVYTGGPLSSPGSYQLYTTANGLPSNNVTGIETVDVKTNWLTTAAGIVKMEESFKPKPNGWSFSNSKANIWPRSWFQQFNYATDPYLGGAVAYPQLNTAGVLTTIPDSTFPDWPLFVKNVGEAQCYQTVAGVKVIKNLAVSRYYTIMDTWKGSCFGFVQTSFMAYDSIQRFRATFPTVGPWTSNKLYDLPLNVENRKCINLMMTRQSQQTYWNYVTPIFTTVDPITTLANVRQMLEDNSRNDRGLLLYNQNGPGGHIVNPYKIVRDTADPDVRFIYIYDNNYPGDSTRRVVVDSVLNCWLYNLSINANSAAYEWGGFTANKGLVVCTPVRDWYNPVNINNVAKLNGPSLLPGSGTIEVYNRDSSDILITNAAGQTEGYQGGQLIQNIPNAIPMLKLTGGADIPKGYHLPEADYVVKLSDFKTPKSSLTLYNSNGGFGFSRTGATLAQKDIIDVTADGILLENQDNLTKTNTLNCVFEDAGNEMNVVISKLGLSPNGTSGLHLFSGTEVKLLNTGSATQYELSLRYVDGNGASKFLHDSVSIAANTAHIIHPDWANLKTAYVMVFVDNGNNTSYEDTLYLGNDQLPQFLTFPTKLEKSAAATFDTIHLINNGGGVLNWSVASADTSWLKIIGANSGVDTGSVIVSVKADTAAARTGLIQFTSTDGAANPYNIVVTQQGLLSTPAGLSASDGIFSDGVHLSWNAAAGATHYQVYRAEYAGIDGNAISGWMSDTTFIDTTANKGQFYYFKVRAAQDSLGKNTTELSLGDDGWAAGFTADFSYSGECSGQPTLFQETSNVHSAYYCRWDINNDGSWDYTGNSIQHTFASAGTYTVKLSVTDSVAYTETRIKTIVIKAFPIIAMVSDTTVCASQSITLNAGSGFASYLWSTGATTASITVDSSGYGLGLTPISVNVMGTNACSVIATTIIKWDTCSSAGGFNLGGIVTYDNNASTVLNNASVMLKQGGSVVHQTTADALGNYVFNNLQSGDYVLTGASDKEWGGVNSTDALRVTRYFVGLISLSSLRAMAADVNGSGFVNAADGLLVAKRFVGLNTSFVVGDWAFTKDTVHIGGVANQVANLKAVVYGDVDGSYIPPAKLQPSLMLTSNGIQLVGKDNTIEIPVRVTDKLEIGAISLVMNIPAQIKAIHNVITKADGNLLYHVSGETLRIAWFSLNPMHLEAGDELLRIQCQLRQDISANAENWTLTAESQLADAEGDTYGALTITIPEVLTDANTFFLSQNIPNPCQTNTEISWFMPEDGKVVISIYDLLGHEVAAFVNANYEKGAHTVVFDAASLRAGTYNYRVEISGLSQHFGQTRKMVVIK